MANKVLNFDIFGRDRGANKAVRGVGKSVGIVSRQFVALGGVIGAALSVRALMNYGEAAVSQFLEAEQAQTKLQDAYKRFPAIADVNIEDLRKLNKQQMLKTGFDDDAYAVAEATLAQYKLTGAQIKTLSPLVADYARKTGRDLPTAATVLGKALLGNGRALKDIGLQYKDTGTLAGNFEQLVTGLNDKVGGYAEEWGNTDAGLIERYKARLSEVQELVGGALLDAFKKLDEEGAIDRFVTSVEELAPRLSELVVNFGDFAADWAQGLNGWISDTDSAGRLVRDTFEAIKNAVPGNALMPVAPDLFGTHYVDEARKRTDEFSQKLLDDYRARTPGWEKAGEEMGTALGSGTAAGVRESAPFASTALGQLLHAATTQQAVAAASANHIGSMLVQGIADGINSSPAAEEAARAMSIKVTTAAKKALQVRSPSKVFEQIGGYVSEGFARGVNQGASAGIQAVGSLVAPPNVAGAGSAAGGDIHIHVDGIYAGDRTQLAKTIQGVLRDAARNGLPANA